MIIKIEGISPNSRIRTTEIAEKDSSKEMTVEMTAEMIVETTVEISQGKSAEQLTSMILKV